ncbi:Permease of the drug/metabolite transporter (DMT) superfamily [Roseivivax marinus]|nr:Permease of the drug/metabolite transporter (DMT) superfamily [Roseivivax marinus]
MPRMTTTSLPTPRSDTVTAALWMTGAIASFSAMAIAGREVSLDLDTFEIMLYRSLIGIALVLTVSSLTGARRQIRAQRMGLHAVRNLSHFAGQNLWFYAVATVPLAQVFAVEFSSPLWVMLLSPLVLGERLTRARVLAGLAGFVGILIVARPSPATFDPNLLAAAGAAVGFAGSAVFTRKLTRTEGITSILFWLTTMQAAFGLVCAGIDGDIAVPDAGAWPLVCVIGAAGLMAHYCLTTALRLAPATVVMPIDFARLPVIALLGMALYSEPLEPAVFLGAAIIFSANYLNIRRERQL